MLGKLRALENSCKSIVCNVFLKRAANLLQLRKLHNRPLSKAVRNSTGGCGLRPSFKTNRTRRDEIGSGSFARILFLQSALKPGIRLKFQGETQAKLIAATARDCS